MNKRKTKKQLLEEIRVLKERTRWYELLVENSPMMICRLLPDGTLTFVNNTYCMYFGKSKEELVGKKFTPLVPPEDHHLIKQLLKNLHPQMEEYTHIHRVILPSGEIRWMKWTNTCFTDETGKLTEYQAIGIDITERMLAEEKAKYIRRLYEVLSQVNQTIVRVKDQEKLLKDICRVIIKFGKFRFVWIGFYDKKTDRVQPTAFCGYEAGYLKKMEISREEGLLGMGPIGRAIRENKSIAFNDLQNHPDFRPWRKEAQKRGYASSIAVPIRMRNRAVGALNIYASEPNFFNEEEIKLLEEIASDISFALEAIEKERKRISAEQEKQRALEALRESEERFRSIVENSHDGIILVNDKYQFVYVNQEFCNLVGRSSDELIGQDFRIVLDEESKIIVADRYRRRQKGEKVPPRYEFNILRKNGELRRVEISSTVIKNSKGNLFTVAQLLDITERKRAEEKVRFLSSMVEQSTEGMALADLRGNLLFVNRAWAKMHGYSSPEELVGKSIDVFHNPDQFKDEVIPFNNRVLEVGWNTGEVGHIRKDGTSFPTLMNITMIKDSQGNPIAFAATAKDITERKRAEEKLRESEERYRLLAENVQDVIFIQDMDLRFLYISPSVTALFGYTPDEILRLNLKDVMTPESLKKAVALFRKEVAISKKDPSHVVPLMEFEYVRKDGSTFWGELRATFLRDFQGRIIATQGVLRDISQRKRAEEEIRKLSRAIQQSPVSIVITDLEGKIEYVNPKFLEVTGYSIEEVLGKKPSILKSGKTSREEYRKLWETITSGKEWRGEFCNCKKNGELFWELVSISPIKDKQGKITHFLGIKEDITLRKHLQQQLNQSQRLEAIGTLAGGVAHDFNNLLTVIIGHAELSLMKLDEAHPSQPDIVSILRASKKAEKLINQLLAFSRKQVYKPEIIDINRVIANLEQMLKRLISEDISIDMHLAKNIPFILADPGQIEQILMNLVVNSRDAIIEKKLKTKEKRITIETYSSHLDEAYLERHPDSQPGEHVVIAVSDTGIGIEESIKNKVFEPFFTTKAMGRGTGLGLSTVFGIVKQNNGSIYVYSEPGRGATFKIYWPAARQKLGSQKSAEMTQEELTGTETILVVEDDAEVRKLTCSALMELGYTIIEASNGKEALKLVTGKKISPDLVLTDLIMPEMNGSELARKLRRIFPEMRILFMSGYTDNHISHSGMLEDGIYLIQKPFSVKELAALIRKTIKKPQ